MSFSASSRNIHLSGATLFAECCTPDNEWKSAKLSLDLVLGNEDGRLVWDGFNFSETSRAISLDGAFLRAQLLDVGQEYHDAVVDLDERIENVCGALTYTGADPTFMWAGISCTEEIDDIQNLEEKRSVAETPLSVLEAFQYSKIDTRSKFRLLKIEAADSRDRPIRCSLEVFELGKSPEYDALSYTWSNPFPDSELDTHYSSPRPVVCNEKRFMVTQNLFDAMQRLRRTRNTEVLFALRKTPLILAAEEGHLSLVQDLLVDGADITARDAFGRTALHHAAKNDHLDVVNALIQAGSPVDAIAEDGHTPAGWAKLQENGTKIDEIVEALKCRSRNLETQPQGISHVGPNLNHQKYIWIDAICINQLDDAEKAAQVEQMGKIYAKAQTVIAWLGSEKQNIADTSVGDLLLSAWRLEAAFDEGTLSNADILCIIKHLDGISRKKRDAIDSWTDSLAQWVSLQWLVDIPFLKRCWFERAWVIQELILAQNVVVLCGPFVLSWDILVLISCITEWYNRLLRRGRYGLQAGPRRRIYIAGFTAVSASNTMTGNPVILLEEKRRAFKSQGQLPWIDALSMSQNAKSSDKRDKVFAVLSMASPIKDNNEEQSVADRHMIQPDYAKPVQELYINTSKSVLDAYGLRMLSFAGHEGISQVPDLPSWTMDLTVSMKYTPLGADTSWIQSPIQHAFLATDETASFLAAGDILHGNAWRVTSKNHLMLQGFRWDTVDDVAALSLDDVGDQCSGLSDWVRLLSPGRRPPNAIRELLWRTLVSDPADGQSSSRDLSGAFVDWLKLLCLIELMAFLPEQIEDLLGDLGEPGAETWPQKSPEEMAALIEDVEQSFIALGIPILTKAEHETWCNFFDYIDDEERMWMLAGFSGDFSNEMLRKDATRRLFRTQNLAVGAGPKFMRPGDMVFIIPDTTVPYILRPVGFQRFKLIGEAYVLGIMGGQALKDSNLHLQELTIV